ncbi:MAG: hypothetical protein NT131_05995 [Methanomassiliicoccales archaeon]|nr:hypothetical protein [Methanomassiliicoccales archaeon]
MVKQKNMATISKKMGGKLKGKNSNYDEVNSLIEKSSFSITSGELELIHLGNRTAWVTKGEINFDYQKMRGGKSYYLNQFKQGATITPISIWSVEVIHNIKLGFNKKKPPVETSNKAKESAKKPYDTIHLKGQVESDYLFGCAIGTDLLSFTHLPLRLVVLPLRPKGNNYTILDRKQVEALGHRGMAEWLKNGEDAWKKGRGEKADKMTLYERLDYSRCLTQQKANTNFVVCYNRSSSHLASSVYDLEKERNEIDARLGIDTIGIVVDNTLYGYWTNEEDEAYYLSGIFNSKIVDDIIKPFQSKGLFGPRDIHTIPLEIDIPKFNKNDGDQKRIASLSKKAHDVSDANRDIILGELKDFDDYLNANALGRVRTKIREKMESELDELEILVKEVLQKQVDKQHLLF